MSPHHLTIDDVLAQIRAELRLSSATERELLEEIRAHLEDAVEDARAAGLDEQSALRQAAQAVGLREVGRELQAVHAPWESADAVIACALPVLCALVLRWLIFAPDGAALNWAQLLARPAFWIVAVAALLVPLLRFQRWRYALAGWSVFWMITVIFVIFPVVSQW